MPYVSLEESITCFIVFQELDDAWRGENTPYDAANKHSDYSIINGNWYKFANYLGRMPEYSMSAQKSCGVMYPAYLNGVHPEKADGIVNRNVSSFTYFSSVVLLQV